MTGIADFFVGLFKWFIGLPWPSIYGFVKAVIITLDVVLFIAFIWVFVKVLEFRPKFLFNPSLAAKKKKKKAVKDPEVAKRWKSLLEKSISSPPQSFIIAIIEADKFVDDVLKKLGIQGEHMADRLEKLNNHDLRTLDKLWRVHRVRNELVHMPDFKISEVDAREILEVYEAFLKEIEVL
ncbi:MAG: hypothetical protein AAB884_00860 [Patescibacteria group bacterium]